MRNHVLNMGFRCYTKLWFFGQLLDTALCFMQAEENLGMVMIFTLVTAVQEKLNEIVDQIKTRREEEKKQKEKEAEEAEKVYLKNLHFLHISLLACLIFIFPFF